MKKFSFLMAIFVSLLFAFVACDPTTEPGGNNGGNNTNPGDSIPNENDTTSTEDPSVDVASADFTSMIIYKADPMTYIFPSLGQFHFQGLTNGATYDPETGACAGNGLLLQVNQAISYVENNLPKSGDYTPFELTSDGYIKEIFQGATGSIAIYQITDGVLDQKNYLSTRDFKVNIKISDTSVKFAVECKVDGEDLVFAFEGAPMLANLSSFWREAKDEGAKFEGAESYAQAEVIYYGETGVLPVNVIEVVLLSQDQTSFANFYCYGSLDNVKNVYGTFKVAAEHTVGTMAKGPGLYVSEEGAYAYPSFIARNYSQNGADYYFVDGGSLTIEEGKISFDLTSLNGSKITTNYAGNISIKSYQEAYPDGALKKAPAKKGAVETSLFEVAPYYILF